MTTLESLLAENAVRKIIVRGDCCSLRAIQHNLDLFPNLTQFVTGEKAPNVAYLDALRGVRAVPAQIMREMLIEKMDSVQLYYFTRQFLMDGVLDTTGADLIVMDSYSDMNFPLYRHRETGATVWLDKFFLRDPQAFGREYEFIGRRSFAEAVDDNVALIEHLRRNSPGAPVLYLSQPIDYYDNLARRVEFNYLGQELAKRVANFYPGATLARHELEPVEMDSCGAGETLHFSARTYRRMIVNALGEAARTEPLEARLERDPLDSFVYSSIGALPAPTREVCGTPASNAMLRLGPSTIECGPGCVERVTGFRKSLDSYLVFEGGDLYEPPANHPALIDVSAYSSFDAWVDAVKPLSKGNKPREAAKAAREGFYCKPFPWALHVADIHEINTSKDVRSGGKMTASYTRTIDEMGGHPTRLLALTWPTCNYHWSIPWGVFVEAPGHKQGDVVVDERLIGYISLSRYGEVALYSQILGHGDFLHRNIMVLLHFEIMRWVLDARTPFTKGLKYLMYGGWESGTGDTLRDWKRRAGFRPYQGFASLYRSPAFDTVDEFGL